MNIPFDKIYVISFVKNINRRNLIRKQFDILNISNYEFIYGIDIYSLKDLLYDSNKHSIYGTDCIDYNIHGISCGLAHFTALQHAQLNNYNKILICEDDILFINDLEYIKQMLNQYPKDADIVKFNSTLFSNINDFQNEVIEKYYMKGWIGSGATCYGIYNKQTINKMIDAYIYKSIIADSYEIIDPNYNLYSLVKMICIVPEQKMIYYTYHKDKNLEFDYKNTLI